MSRPVLKRALRRCEYPRCWHRRTVEAVLERRNGTGRIVQWFCDLHADHLATRAMRGADRVQVWDDDTGGVTELLGFDAAVRRLSLQKGIPLRQARRELERQRGRR